MIIGNSHQLVPREIGLYTDRILPHDIEAEHSVIGSLLLDGDSLSKVSSILKATDFYLEKNRHCFEACLDLAGRNEVINQVTVAHELSIQEKLDSIGGSGHLSDIANGVPSPAHILHFAQIVHRTSIMRQLVHAAGSIAEIG